jgi:hypothetical protein
MLRWTMMTSPCGRATRRHSTIHRPPSTNSAASATRRAHRYHNGPTPNVVGALLLYSNELDIEGSHRPRPWLRTSQPEYLLPVLDAYAEVQETNTHGLAHGGNIASAADPGHG